MILNKIRSQPRHIKGIIIWTTSLLIVGGVFVLWILALKSSFQKMKLGDTKELIEISKEIPPLTENLRAEMGGLKEMLKKMEQAESGIKN